MNRSPHAVTWLVWALAAAASVQLAPSPPYVALVIAIAALVVEVHHPPGGSPYSRAFPAVVALGVAFGLVRVALDVLTTHGVGDVLFTLPEVTLPRLMGGFTVGGTVEGAVLIQSAVQAFAVVGVMAAFGAFNSVVSHHELLQSAPAAFHEPGLVVTVALALVPSTIAATRAVREADRARTGGRIVRRGRLVRLVVPVLESGMERAVGLAEAMDARGFGHDAGGPADRAAGWLLGLGGLLALGGSIVALVGRTGAMASVLAVAGVGLVVAAIATTSLGRRRARYRHRRPTVRDGAMALAAVATPVGLVLLGAGDGGTTWAVTGGLPPFDPRAALALVGLAAPALWSGGVPTPAGPAVDRDGAGRPPPLARAAHGRADARARGGRDPPVSGLSWREVGFAYPDGPPALRVPALDVAAGEVVVVAGPSGSGKSTLLRTANGLVPHGSGGRFSGDVVVFGRSVRTHSPRRLADVVGFVHQDPEAQFVVDRVEADVAFSLENLGADPAAMRRRVEEVLDALGIAHLRDRSPATLSGGERQRAAVAGALAAAPSALVLDEPTSQLDPQGADDVLAAVARLNADLGTTILLAEHRLERAAPLADRALLVEGGTVVGDGLPGAVLAGYAGAPTVTQLGRLLGWDPPPLTVRDARRTAARDGLPGALPAPPADGWAAAGATPGQVLVAADGLGVRLGGRPVLHDVDVEVHAGEVVALLGRNGSGKTTLLRALAGLASPSAGRVRRAAAVAYVPQDPGSLLFAATVRAELEETRRLLGRPDPAAVERWLDALGLAAVAGRRPRSLSGGERQRVAVAAVAVGGAEVLLLDEPTRGMDAPSRAALERAARAHAAGGGAVVVATHDVELAARVATRAVVLGAGDVVAAGPARAVLAGSLFAPQVLRVLPPFLTVEEVEAALAGAGGAAAGRAAPA